MKTAVRKKMSPQFDPWEAYMDVEEFGEMRLTNIEFTTTNICNMRCEHCAVGHVLTHKDEEGLPLELLIKRLDEIPNLRTMSITGGEPMLSNKSIDDYVVPLFKYAHERGVRTQINSNLTLEFEKYEKIIPYLDVLHISHNWGTVEEFAERGFAKMDRKPTFDQRAAYFNRIVENSKRLSEAGVFVSAETLLNKKTAPYLEKIHKQIVEEMGCQRHEVHPMYPSDFARELEFLTKDEIRETIEKLLEVRDENVWMLFGTLPFYHCSDDERDLALLEKLKAAKNVTLRNDPDGRSRLNINVFDGSIIVTDFGDIPVLGNIKDRSVEECYNEWAATDLAKSLTCHCPSVKCLGPNVLVTERYYQGVDFTTRKAK